MMLQKPELHITSRYENNKNEVTVHVPQMPTQEGDLFLRLVERWGMVSAVDDGEDSAGRARVRVASPAELIERAAAVTELAIATLEERQWLYFLPSYDKIVNHTPKED